MSKPKFDWLPDVFGRSRQGSTSLKDCARWQFVFKIYKSEVSVLAQVQIADVAKTSL